jgi:hypothetical protein
MKTSRIRKLSSSNLIFVNNSFLTLLLSQRLRYILQYRLQRETNWISLSD